MRFALVFTILTLLLSVAHADPFPCDHLLAKAPLQKPKFLVSNEQSHWLFFQALEKVTPGEAYVGIGGTPNYTLIAKARASEAYIYDADPGIIASHLLNRAAFLTSETPEAFIHFYSSDGRAEAEKTIAKLYPSDAQRLIEFYRATQNDTYFHLEDTLIRTTDKDNFKLSRVTSRTADGNTETTYRVYQGMTSLGQKPGPTTSYSSLATASQDPHLGQLYTFLGDPTAYQHIRNLFREDRVHFFVGNHDHAKNVLSEIASLINKKNQKLGVFYSTNAISERWTDISRDFCRGLNALSSLGKPISLMTWVQPLEKFGVPTSKYTVWGSRSENMADWQYTSLATRDLYERLCAGYR